ncbi:proline-specific peptidase [Phanerochaete sordida]|uniref:Proline-specific peptidase n=1 Tax=Phanerochaete sordida TaxID=48140 RepID=A0A9P3LEF4_9APHY|nr:proline-specific peptidase [Phanerochaete sordida]
MTESTGHVTWTYKGEELQTWYKVVGDLHSFPTPVIALHGGPGMPHIMETHDTLHTAHGIPVVIYDQVGCGRSTRLGGKPADFFAFELWFAELDALLAHLRVASRFALVGHSWGGALAAEYTAARQPAGLRALVVVGMPGDLQVWTRCARRLLTAGWPDKLAYLERCEEEGKLDDAEYRAVYGEYFQKHMISVTPWPKPFADGISAMLEDPTVPGHLMGPYKLKVSGTLRDWKIARNAPKIHVPTLLVSGINDQAQEETMRPWFNGIPKIKWVVFAHSCHVPFFEEPDRYFDIVANFVRDLQ